MSDDLPLEVHLRNPPCWRQDGATYFVTFCLRDAVPAEFIREQEAKVQRLYRELGLPADTVVDGAESASEPLRHLHQQQAREMAKILDEGRGAAVLGATKFRAPVAEAIAYHAEHTCEVYAYVIMPNHVHALVRPLPRKNLDKIFEGIRSFSSRKIGNPGMEWHSGSQDTIIRDEEHFRRAADYIRANPYEARLRRSEYELFEDPVRQPG